MNRKKYDIFISYRRDTGAQYARILQLMLSQRGYHVFLDYDELKDGVFSDKIREAIHEAPVFILILSAGALERCANEGDWVRREILMAVDQNKHIIPVNPDNTFTGVPTHIPEAIQRAVSSHQHSEIGFGQILGVTIDMMVQNRLIPTLGVRAQEQHIDVDVDSARKTLDRMKRRSRFYKIVALLTSVVVIAVVLVVAYVVYQHVQEDEVRRSLDARKMELEQTYKDPFLLNLSSGLSRQQLDAVEDVLSRMVRVNDTLYISKFECTVGQWYGILGRDFDPQKKDYPMTHQSRGEILLNLLIPLRDITSIEFDLPSAREWIYAAKGGDRPDGTLYSGSDRVDEVAWYGGNSGAQVHESNGQQGKGPNSLDLYDMSGNVAEMSNSPYPASDGAHTLYTVCGGDYTSQAAEVTTESVAGLDSDARSEKVGFRLVIRILNH